MFWYFIVLEYIDSIGAVMTDETAGYDKRTTSDG